MPESLPPSGLFVDQALINTFTDAINQLIADLGLQTLLHLPPKQTDCPNCDISGYRGRKSGRRYTSGGPEVFGQGGVCSWCEGKGFLIEHQNATYTALIENFQDDINFKDRWQARLSENEIFTTMQVVALTDIRRAESLEYFGERYRLVQGPIVVGLKDKEFVEAKWERIEQTGTTL